MGRNAGGLYRRNYLIYYLVAFLYCAAIPLLYLILATMFELELNKKFPGVKLLRILFKHIGSFLAGFKRFKNK